MFIPTFIANAEFQPAQVRPRVFFYNGKLETTTYNIKGKQSSFSSTIRQYDIYPYFDHYNTGSSTDGLPQADSDSLLFFNEGPSLGVAPTNSIYTEYWDKYIQLLYDPKTRLLECSAVLPFANYVNMELNDIVVFRGNHYHLRAINKYNLKTGECDLQLLGPIIDDALDGTESNCYTFSIVGDPESATEFTWTDCDGGYQSMTVSAGQGVSIYCVRPGTMSADMEGAEITQGAVCGTYVSL
mgnify:CR=1 FL=1|tara:strand:+ start:18105 stop:18827 length:723 start_codon:yes stop_codon:yes gene_type:complete